MLSIGPVGLILASDQHDSTAVVDSREVAWPTRSLTLFYLITLGTLGLCLPFWVYHNARALEPDASAKRKHIWWAIGFLTPIIAILEVYELARVGASKVAQSGGPRPWAPRIIAVCAPAIFFAVVFADRLHRIHSLKLLLLPIPVLIAHTALRRLAALQPVAARPPARKYWTRLASALAFPAIAGGYYLDAGVLQYLGSQTYTRGMQVSGTSGRYSMMVDDGRWRRVAPGSHGSKNTELELERIDGNAWLAAYVEPDLGTGLDARVTLRKQLVEGATKLAGFRETRYFIVGTDFKVMSEARYDVATRVGPQAFWVLTTIVDGKVMELLMHSSKPDADLRSVMALFRTFRLTTPRSGP